MGQSSDWVLMINEILDDFFSWVHWLSTAARISKKMPQPELINIQYSIVKKVRNIELKI